MHEILVLSGKGGTGKTSLTAAFAHLSKESILCDLDVDAPDLHLLLDPRPSPATPFVSGFAPEIDTERCTDCGICSDMCRFHAVSRRDDLPRVDPIRCEGCGVCAHFCPAGAIAFEPKTCGEWRISRTRFGSMVHAQLYPGEENSGKLVALLRKESRKLAEQEGARLILSDGPPGIGCPVISALSGIDLAVMVTEPTPTGLHDLKRVVELCDHFQVPTAVLINKCDLNPEIAGPIRAFCQERDMPLLAELPHDNDFVHAMVQAQTITEYAPNSESGRHVRAAWERIEQRAAALEPS
jgi:MinD superfamily P-loop ATPase